jgi:thioredoxin 1
MKSLDADSFDDVTSSGKVIVDFWAEWCGPCKQLAPIYKELSEEFDDYQFTKLDVEAHQDVAQQVGVRGIPTLIFYDDGDEVARVQGFMQKEALRKKIESAFA